MLRLRIPPRKFKGVILDWTVEMSTNSNFSVFLNDILEEGESYHDLSEDELYVRFVEFYKKLKNNNQASIHLHVSNLRRLFINSMLEACKENPENIIPVYDLDGNLVWPEEMPYDQIVLSSKD
jgi:hypothetical protein